LQMAQAMGAVASSGTFYRTRLVQQVQSLDDKIVTGYEVALRAQLDIKPEIMAEVRKAMINVVTGGRGTAHQAAVPNIEVAGKTGTAQWGAKKKERNAAWFAGFAPANDPKYAFAAVYEGEIGQSAHGGIYSAPMIGKVLRELYKDAAKPSKHKKHKHGDDEDDQDQDQDNPPEKPHKHKTGTEPESKPEAKPTPEDSGDVSD